MKIRFFNTGRDYQVETLGVNRPRPTPIDKLSVGEVGFLTASIKTVADVQIGDTIRLVVDADPTLTNNYMVRPDGSITNW